MRNGNAAETSRRFASDNATTPRPAGSLAPSVLHHNPRGNRPVKRCAVVIPTKNGGPLFRRVVEGLQQQTCWSEVELIVVDSGSSDDTVAIARSGGAIVHSISPADFDHGATRDYGISLTSCEFILLTVQDAVPHNDQVIEKLVRALQEDGVGGAYGRQIPQPTADVLTQRNLNGWLTGRLKREVRLMSSPQWYEALSPLERYYFCNFDNVCSAIRRSVWETEPFGRASFGEDIDWAERVLRRGFKIVYEPEAAVVHSHDRPLSYEYKRTYVCHRKLYRQFGLQLMPSMRSIGRAWLTATINDLKYVFRVENRLRQRLRMTLRVPLLNILSAYAQFRAAKDEIRGTENPIRGV